MSDFSEMQSVAKFVLSSFNPQLFPNLTFSSKQMIHQFQKNHQLFTLLRSLQSDLSPKIEEISRLLENEKGKEKAKYMLIDSEEFNKLKESVGKLNSIVEDRETTIVGLQSKVKDFDEKFDHVGLLYTCRFSKNSSSLH